MIKKPLIKICGVRNEFEAESVIKAGADFMGLVFHPLSKRNVTIEKARSIAALAHAKNKKAVAVFVDQTADEMLSILAATEINMVQLHGMNALQEHHLLPEHLPRIYAVTTEATRPFDFKLLDYCLGRDFLLFDHPDPGHGQTFDWDTFHPPGHCRIGIAGGLNPSNIKIAIKKMSPDLVDVSSGVEHPSGHKDPILMQQFVLAVRSASS